MDFLVKNRAYLYVIISIIFIIIFASIIYDRKSEGASINFLNIGQGNSAIIKLPHGATIIIDGGPNRELIRRVGKYLPFWKNYIDMIFITNTDTDHYYGLFDMCDRYRVGLVIIPPRYKNNDTFSKLLKCFRDNGAGITYGYSSKEIMIDDTSINVLFPDRNMSEFDSNDGSQILLITIESKKFLFMGDAPKKIERYLNKILKSFGIDYIIVGHHGSKTSSDSKWISRFASSTAIISAGKDNKYGHPNKETIDILNKFNYKILKTFEIGDIVINI